MTSGYILEAAWMMLRSTKGSSLAFSSMPLMLSSTSRLKLSFSRDGMAGAAKASARKSAPQRRSSGSEAGLMMGRMPCTIIG